MDLLAQLVGYSNDYATDVIGTDEYRAQLQRLVTLMNANEFKAIADVIVMNAIHLRNRGH